MLGVSSGEGHVVDWASRLRQLPRWALLWSRRAIDLLKLPSWIHLRQHRQPNVPHVSGWSGGEYGAHDLQQLRNREVLDGG